MILNRFQFCKKTVLLVCTVLLHFSLFGQFQIVNKAGLFNGIDGLDISPKNNYFLGWYEYNGACVIWDMRSGQEIQKFQDVKTARFASNGEQIYIVTKSGDIKLVDLTGKTIRQISRSPIMIGSYRNYNFYPEQLSLIIENKLYDVNVGLVSTLNYEGLKDRQQYNLRKNLLVVPDNQKNKVSIIQLPGGQQKSVNLPFRPWTVVLSAMGNHAAILGRDTLQIIQLENGETIGSRKFIPQQYGAVLFDHKGENLIYTSYDEKWTRVLVCENAISGKTIWKRSFTEKLASDESIEYRNLQLSADGKILLAANGSQGQYELFDVATGKTIKEIKSFKRDFAVSLGKIVANQLPIIYKDEQVILNLTTGVIQAKTKYDDTYTRTLTDAEYESFPIQEVIKSFDKKFEFVKSPMLLNQGVACANSGGVSQILNIRSVQTKRTIFSRSCKWITYGAANTQNIIAIQEIPAVDRINFYNYTTGQKLFTIPFNIRMKGGHRPVLFSPNDAYVTVEHDDGLLILDLKTKKSLSAKLGKEPSEGVVGFTPDNKYALINIWKKIKFLDLATGEYNESMTIHEIDPRYGFNTVSMTPDGKHLFYIDGDKNNRILVYDLVAKRNIATVYPFLSTNDWAVVSPDGLFEANKGAQDNVYYTTPNSVAPLGTVFDQFFTPRLLPRILSGETFKAPDINTLKAIPTVAIQYSEGTRNLIVENEFEQLVTTNKSTGVITVKADCPVDKITEIRLYHNGKLTGTTRNLIVEDDTGQKSMTRTFNVTLSSGDNVFSAVAVNSQRSESKQVFIKARYQPSNNSIPENIKQTSARLHLIIVGINAYKNPRYSLNYAQKDATAFRAAIERGSKEIFSGINTYFISDAEATKQGIQNALEKVKLNANADDLFIFYYAGHGVLDEKNEFYLIPYDVTQLYGNDQLLRQSAISSSLIQLYSKDIKAQKQLFILDACQSAGAFGNAVAMRGAAEEKAIAQLARSTGTHWLTASGSDQFASEFSQLGHGSFTYCLLEALRGKADNGDKKLTVKEIDAYLQSVVPEITKKYKGTAQYPASFGYGNDFPIIIIK
ncbi:MAG: caspase family protein [Chitinophagaceae bacterium]|uniref:caspase family protein n=1 Tax=Sediminibacterium sp. TaxID=1917865 RepID=UPI001BBE7D1B|nr:caspase family protein [Sediminibacterium sp.]MBS4065569.1 caspase family protein [Chitinophagaceae bacterium]MDZ4072705.1 caspase family protein [Sediminibacterium sp.]